MHIALCRSLAAALTTALSCSAVLAQTTTAWPTQPIRRIARLGAVVKATGMQDE